MALLSDADRTNLVQHLAPIGKQVDLLLFTQTFGGSESGPIAKQVLDEVASLHDRIRVVEKNFVLDTEDRAKYTVDKSPAIVVLSDGADTRMRLYGAPTGYEFVSLIEAVVLAGTGTLELEPETVAALAEVTEPLHLQVFTTPS
jgi:alkyl hydroperoxide reductase subunit AhpF